MTSVLVAKRLVELPSQDDIMSAWQTQAITVSISCITFNHGPYVEQALSSMLSQKTTFPFEILVHDDASTDDTAEVIRRFAQAYPAIVKPVLQTENQYSRGKKPGMDFNFPRAQGRYIAVCEGDDYWQDPLKLEKQVAFLEATPACVACGHDAIRLENGQLAGRPDLCRTAASGLEMQQGIFILPVTILFRNVTQDIPPETRLVVNADTFLYSFLGSYGGYQYLADIEPSVYRIHEGGVWSLLDERKKVSARITTMYWMSRYYDRVGNDPLAWHFLMKGVLCHLELVRKYSLSRFAGYVWMFAKLWLKGGLPWLTRLVHRIKGIK